MPSSFLHRILCICPVAKVAAVVTWLRANIDAAHDINLGPPLNASGLAADPVTYRWFCGSYVDSDCRQILNKLCQLASVATPSLATWNGWTGAEKRSWLLSVRDTILVNYGVYVTLADNTATWDDAQALLVSLGLKTIGVG
jgi:hypothetical protein